MSLVPMRKAVLFSYVNQTCSRCRVRIYWCVKHCFCGSTSPFKKKKIESKCPVVHCILAHALNDDNTHSNLTTYSLSVFTSWEFFESTKPFPRKKNFSSRGKLNLFCFQIIRHLTNSKHKLFRRQFFQIS